MFLILFLGCSHSGHIWSYLVLFGLTVCRLPRHPCRCASHRFPACRRRDTCSASSTPARASTASRDNRRRNRPANTFERYKEHSSPRSPCSRDVRCQSYPPHAQTQAFTRLRTYAGAISLACLAKNVRNKQTKTQQPQRRRRMSLRRRRRRRLTREVRCATRSTTI